MKTATTPWSQLAQSAIVTEWTGLGQDEDGSWELLAHYGDKNVHVYGTFGGATVILQGSNEDTPAAPATLRDPTKTALSLSVALPMEQVLEAPLKIRPLVVGGDGTTALTVRLVSRR